MNNIQQTIEKLEWQNDKGCDSETSRTIAMLTALNELVQQLEGIHLALGEIAEQITGINKARSK